jgi:hypothetical protein
VRKNNLSTIVSKKGVKGLMLLAKEIQDYQSYTDMEVAHQREVNNFPMCFIIGSKDTEQIKDELKRTLGTDNFEEVMKTPYGGIIKKSDAEFFEFMFTHHQRERAHFVENEKNLVSAIVSEMYSHEYGYTLEPDDVLNALGRDASAFLDEKFARCFEKAKKIVLKEAA